MIQIVFAFCIEKQRPAENKEYEIQSLWVLVKMGSSSSLGLLSSIQFAKLWISKAARIDESISDDDKEVRGGGVEGMIGWALNSGV